METDEGKDPYQVSDIENDWGSRHLFRMPYSLHDGSWLVSLPIKPEQIDKFEKSDAEMDKVINMTLESYCPVWSMMKGNVELVTNFNINSPQMV